MYQHTLGPWSYHGGFGQCVKAGLNVVAECRKPPLNPAECEANAHLIAAAPDLLAACKGAMRIVSLWNGREVPEDHKHAEEMKALYLMQEAFIYAIAKAEGKSK